MVTRIEGTPLAQSGTLGEMLIKVPGMTGSDEAPEVLGKGSPLIYINGRKMRDASELKRLHSEDIRDVEVINAPGAQYDAQVRAVVRIRTRNYHTIRHKPLHNIPLMQGFLQLSVILQRHIRQISQRIN